MARDEALGEYVVTGYEACRRVLQDARLLRDRKRASPGSAASRTYDAPPDDVPERKNGAGVFIFMDGEDHRRLRRLIGDPLLARVRTGRPLVEKVVRRTLSALPTSGAFDLVDDYAIPIPVGVISTLLGLPEKDHERVRAWSDELVLGFNPFRTKEEDARRWKAVRSMLDYFGARVEAARKQKTEDLISDWVALEEQGAGLSEREIIDHCVMMLTAGNLSTTDLIANAARAVLEDPALQARVREDPNVLSEVIEESLRVDPPVTTTDRIAPGEMSVGGCPMHGGDVMVTSLLAANHDSGVYEQPHVFKIDRPARQHLAFGAGARICLGAPLARLEASVALRELFAQRPDLTLVGDVSLRPVYGHHGPKSLRVVG
ncbi:MAG: cytochrome P450 [Hyphomonadaceae bacterium]|nr:cytochrome P450 [Hyphomonadaceae bacterium]